MSAPRLSTKMLRVASLRPVASQLGASRAAINARRYQSNPPGASNRKPGEPTQGQTEKVYEKDGTNPNKNLVYIGAAALALGGYYAFFMARPGKAVEKTKQAGEKVQGMGDSAR